VAVARFVTSALPTLKDERLDMDIAHPDPLNPLNSHWMMRYETGCHPLLVVLHERRAADGMPRRCLQTVAPISLHLTPRCTAKRTDGIGNFLLNLLNKQSWGMDSGLMVGINMMTGALCFTRLKL
jgi:hypothetical protein